MKNSKFLNQSGYTLIELLIVILIISIMTSILIPTFTQKARLSDVKLGAETLRGVFLNAQVMALTNSKSRIAQLCAQTSNTQSIVPDEANYLFVDYTQAESTATSLQIFVSKEKNKQNACPVEKKVFLASNLKIDDSFTLLFFTVGKNEISADSLDGNEASFFLYPKSNPDMRVKVIVNIISGQVRIE
jgi:prepilin-type N-terminal cleavage/methylation domain-containing protein